MRQRREEEMLGDIVDRCDFVMGIAEELDREGFASDDLRSSAVMYGLVIIGEAASQLPETFRRAQPSIIWRDVIDFRNFLIHAYARVRNDMVWTTITEEIPVLREQVMTIVRAEYPLVAEALDARAGEEDL